MGGGFDGQLEIRELMGQDFQVSSSLEHITTQQTHGQGSTPNLSVKISSIFHVDLPRTI